MRFLLLCFVLICSANPAEAQDVFNQYDKIKSVIASSYRSTSFLQYDLPENTRRVGPNRCLWGIDLYGPNNGQEAQIESMKLLAVRMVDIDFNMGKTKYPPSVWKQIVKEFELKNLHRIANSPVILKELDNMNDPDQIALRNKIVRNAERYRLRHARKRLPIVESEVEGCGAGEIEVVIVTNPTARRIQYINAIDFNICASLGRDPNDLTQCSYWTDYSVSATPNESGAFLAGNYYVIVRWYSSDSVLLRMNVDELPKNTYDGHKVYFHVNQ